MSRERLGGVGAVLDDELMRAQAAGAGGQSVVLVEGASDRRAVEALARRLGRDLDHEGVAVVPTAGATNIARFFEMLGPSGWNVRIAGLCDAGEEDELRSAIERAGLGRNLTRASMERLGFYVCVRDLEEELIRALGAERLLDVIAAEGHSRRFHTFQNQPAQRGKTIERQIWRWLGNHKIRYAPLMVDALDLDSTPAPLLGVLAAV